MKTFTSIYNNWLILILLFCFFSNSNAQADTSSFILRIPADTSKQNMNMDAVYNRPFLTAGKLPIAIGGYLEANSQYEQIDGVSEGLSFQARRFTLFFSSTIARNIKFLSELEFEDGTNEINIEFAALDIEFHSLFNLRGGIVMNPIGAFNQNHDGPVWDYVDRPISATTIIPSTLSNAGFGLHGKYFVKRWIFGYEAYLTNGFDDNIISNDENRTSLSAGKKNPMRFKENNSGMPMFTGKLAIRNRKVGELGLSYLTGVYNNWIEGGLILDKKRNISVLGVDFNTSLLKDRLAITGEFAKVVVDIPETYTIQYGQKQFGAFLDIKGTILKRRIFAWDNAKLNLGIRLEYADYNQGRFIETGGNVADDVWAVVPSIAFRPTGTTVIRFNYRFEQQRDLFGNPPALKGVFQFGFSTYF